MLAGVAFFLLAMSFMEDALRLLAGRKFKIFLKQQTNNRLKAIGGGAIVTGLLQSSSIVNLIILSMVGAGVVKMENALAIMLGSNLGTTLDSWLVAAVGFNLTIETWALPAAAITGICMTLLNKEKKLFLWLKFLFSLAFLFIALGFIKTGMEDWVKQTDLSSFTKYPVLIFLFLGIFLTAIIQSSSATIALTLSALYSNAITLYIATAIVLGSEIGTTLKLFLASVKGLPAKKRVALGNFLFNAITVSIIFLLLRPVNKLLTDVLYIEDNLIALVFFQTFVNLCSIILFFPFLKLFGRFLLYQFTGRTNESFYISKVPVADTDLALEALENETKHFISHVIDYSLSSFNLRGITNDDTPEHKKVYQKTIAEKYNYIKHLHGEMHSFCLKLQQVSTEKNETERLNQLISAIRNCMYAAKNINDAQHDIEQMSNSSNDIKYNFYISARDKTLNFYEHIDLLLTKSKDFNQFEELTKAYNTVTKGYLQTLESLYKSNLANKINEVEISTLINFNRELYTSFKSVLFGLKDYLLTTKEAAYFDALPGFIR